MSDRTARADYAAVWLEICRRSLAGIEPGDAPTQLFDPDDDDLADAIVRHPAGGAA
jgi:hypothetical protein